MTNHSLTIALLATALGCGEVGHDQTNDGTGGVVGTGGSSTGGGVGTGGSVGVGGSVSTGGAISTGGVVSTGGSSEGDGGTLYTFDLAGFGTSETPGLNIANETLAFPLALGPAVQSLSQANPGDLVVAYTRVGCWIDPVEWFGSDDSPPIELPQAEPVVLTHVTIDQRLEAGVTGTPSDLAEQTCLTLESPEGAWSPFLEPQTVTQLSADSVRAEFVIDGTLAEGAAIFLPTYTTVATISYRVAAP